MNDDFHVLKSHLLFPVSLSQWWRQRSCLRTSSEGLLLEYTRPPKGIRPSPKTLVPLFQQYVIFLRSLQSMELSTTSRGGDVGGREKLMREDFEGWCKLWKKHHVKHPKTWRPTWNSLGSWFQHVPYAAHEAKQGFKGEGQGRHHSWGKDIKRNDWSLPKSTWTNRNPSGKMFCGQMKQK